VYCQWSIPVTSRPYCLATQRHYHGAQTTTCTNQPTNQPTIDTHIHVVHGTISDGVIECYLKERVVECHDRSASIGGACQRDSGSRHLPNKPHGSLSQCPTLHAPSISILLQPYTMRHQDDAPKAQSHREQAHDDGVC
jgi:hypothetical protein